MNQARHAIQATQSHPASAGVFEPGLLRAHRLFESSDLDDTRERISSVMQPHRLEPLGRFGQPSRRGHGRRSHMDFVRMGGVGLGTIDFGEAMRVDVDHVEDYHLLMFCLRGQAQTLAGGKPVEATTSRGMICAPGSSFVADLSPDCEQFVVRLDRRMVQAHAGREVLFNHDLDLRRPGLQAWFDQLRVLATSSTLVETARSNPLIAVELERLLVHLLLAGQEWTDAAKPVIHNAATMGTAPACVRRAEAYIHAHADQPLRLSDIAAAANVPSRTLLEAFQRFRNHSPVQYLREVRLELAHRQLSAPEASSTVASIALDCGFLHLGRFAQAYRERFGQSPSATLQAAG
ncbi:MAG: AraC family transcriptional regulator [Comamonadaceae bacterium]|nr:MAG: AraC family transcriptional regulator [Comamonadaceae bacterium]